jgi:Condensin II complex subunit CAP-H2 or CNDH2, N-terminal/Condensin II complex subunit CAP-H2 or CNDH2, C-term
LAQIAPPGVTISTDLASSSTDTDDQDKSAVPNFAHAALILQNSSNVYGRKVEYLHSLVYKALEEIFKSAHNAPSSANNGRNGRRSRTADADIEEFYDFDPHEDFLLLDDAIPEDLSACKKKINLPASMIVTAGGGSGEDGTGMRRYSSGTTPIDRSSVTLPNRSQLSLGGLSVTRLDGSAVTGRGSSSISPAQQRALLGILNSGDLRLVDRQCDVGADGTLLIPGSSQQSASASSYASRQSLVENGTTNPNGGRRSLFGDEYSNVASDNNGEVVEIEKGDVDIPDYGNDDDDDDGAGFVMNDYGDDGDASHQQGPSGDQTGALQNSKRVRFATDAVNVPTRTEQNTKKKKADPWSLLDPHSAQDTKLAKKPLRKGRTYRLPEGVDKPPSACVTGSSTTNVAQRSHAVSWKQQELRPSLVVESFRIAMGKQLVPEESSFASTKQPFKGLVFGDEFLYIAKENARKRAARRRAERRQQKLVMEGTASATRDNMGGGVANGPYDDDNEDDYGYDGGFDFAGGGGDDYDDDDDSGTGNAGFGTLDDAFRRPGEDGNIGTWRIYYVLIQFIELLLDELLSHCGALTLVML